MANIKIKGRTESIIISNDLAKKIKLLKFGDENGNNKASSTDLIDLGEWAGEIGEIRSIEIEKPRTNSYTQPDLTEEERANVRVLLEKYKPDFLKR